jgi:hypothetical protein
MLGCIKIIIASRSKNDIELLADICELLDASRTNHEERNEEDLVEPTATRNFKTDIDAIREVIMTFVSLLVEIESTRGKTGKEKIDVSSLVAIIGELVSCFDHFGKHLKESSCIDPRVELTDYIISQCHRNLVAPSGSLSQTLTQLLLLRCPASVADRFNRATEISHLINQCAQNKDLQISEIIDGAESQESLDISNRMGIEVFTILSTSTLTETTICYFGILENCLTEVSDIIFQ